MKRHLLFFLACAFLSCLCACGAPVGTTATSDAPKITVPPHVRDRREETPIEIVPGYFDGEIYISLANESCDYYQDSPGFRPGLSFRILSAREIGTGNIQVALPMQTPHTVEILDQTAEYHTLQDWSSEEAGSFAFWHYLLLQKPDWDYLAQVKEDEAALAKWRLEHRVGEGSREMTDPEEIALDSRVAAGALYIQQYNDGFEQFSAEEIPAFYVYLVLITPTEPFAEETVGQIEITVGKKTIPLSFGAWRFHRDTPPEIATSDSFGVRLDSQGVMGLDGTFCDCGFAMVRDAFCFTVGKEDITVTDIAADREEYTLMGARIRLLTQDQQTASDYYWDLKSPLDLDAGQSVAVDLVLRSDRFLEYEFNGTMYPSLEYEIGERPHRLVSPCYLKRSNDILETYFAMFEGVELSEVYRYNTYANACIYAELPDDWKETE